GERLRRRPLRGKSHAGDLIVRAPRRGSLAACFSSMWLPETWPGLTGGGQGGHRRGYAPMDNPRVTSRPVICGPRAALTGSPVGSAGPTARPVSAKSRGRGYRPTSPVVGAPAWAFTLRLLRRYPAARATVPTRPWRVQSGSREEGPRRALDLQRLASIRMKATRAISSDRFAQA